MRPYGTANQLEKRRRKAIELLSSGEKPTTVARRVNSALSSIYLWWQQFRDRGDEGLKPKPTPGRTPKLSKAQQEKLIQLLLKGAKAAGYSTELWTLERIAELIENKFGVSYHPSHVWKLLRKLEWSSQKPERRSMERNEEEIKKWKRSTWPRIKKKSKT
jgi:transposase